MVFRMQAQEWTVWNNARTSDILSCKLSVVPVCELDLENISLLLGDGQDALPGPQPKKTLKMVTKNSRLMDALYRHEGHNALTEGNRPDTELNLFQANYEFWQLCCLVSVSLTNLQKRIYLYFVPLKHPYMYQLQATCTTRKRIICQLQAQRSEESGVQLHFPFTPPMSWHTKWATEPECPQYASFADFIRNQ